MQSIPENVINICRRIKEYGGNSYIVGGYVRDTLLGLYPKDIDLVVISLDFRSLLTIFPQGKIIGKDFPVLQIDGIEVALARKERKTGYGYTGFTCETQNVTLEEDLFRRDLTINAMAYDPFSGAIIDPFGGIKSLQKKELSPAGPHFGEDPLRVLRAARFAAKYDMSLTPLLITASEVVLPELITLSSERIWGELEKALVTSKPSLFVVALDSLGALEIILPEIYALKGRIQPEKYHPEGDAYIHTLLVLDRARELNADPETTFAALVHDLGKAVTPDHQLPHHYNHEALGVPIIKAFCERLRVPNNSRDVAIATSREHLNCHRFLELKPTTKVRFLTRLHALHNDILLSRVSLAAQADAQGRGPDFINKPYPQRQAMLDAASKIRTITGHAFVHLKDGQKIAQKLEQERAKLL